MLVTGYWILDTGYSMLDDGLNDRAGSWIRSLIEWKELNGLTYRVQGKGRAWVQISDCHEVVFGLRGFEYLGFYYLIELSDAIGLKVKLTSPGIQHPASSIEHRESSIAYQIAGIFNYF